MNDCKNEYKDNNSNNYNKYDDPLASRRTNRGNNNSDNPLISPRTDGSAREWI